MKLKIFNTLTRKKEIFKPIKKEDVKSYTSGPSEVSLYTCGPTVYDYAHIGNLRTYIFEDILKRALIFNGYIVKHVMNITDVGHLTSDSDTGDDKIEKSARTQSKSAWKIAEFYAQAFKNDLGKLNIIEPDIWAKATDHIKEQIDLIKILEKKKYIYKTSDGLYFNTAKFSKYGKLARLNIQGQEEGARIEVNKEKKNASDFAVWKFSHTGKPSFGFAQDDASARRQMEWDSPWGVGFPGWHIECSAMAMKYLGETIDIHAGGVDHVPVHHTNEIAQSEAATGKRFAHYWMHGEFLLINEGRMGKSEGNFITLSSLEEKRYDPIVYKLFCLSAHYRSKLNFSWSALDGAKNNWEKLKAKFLSLENKNGKINNRFLKKFAKAVNDDLAMPEALAVVWEVLKARIADVDKRATLLEFDKVIGLGLDKIKEENIEVPKEIESMLNERELARKAQDWKRADEIRKKIGEMGWAVEDFEDSYKVIKLL